MADIASYLNDIKNAIFGKEVRGSIHDGIKVMNDEVEKTTSRQEYLEATFDELIINEGNSNAEIVAARVEAGGKSYKKLGDRLNNFDEQFNAKTSYSYVDDKISSIVSGTPKGHFNNLSELQSTFPTGAEGIYITLDNGNWNYWSGENWASGGIYQATSTDYNNVKGNINLIGTNYTSYNDSVFSVSDEVISITNSKYGGIINTDSLHVDNFQNLYLSMLLKSEKEVYIAFFDNGYGYKGAIKIQSNSDGYVIVNKIISVDQIKAFNISSNFKIGFLTNSTEWKIKYPTVSDTNYNQDLLQKEFNKIYTLITDNKIIIDSNITNSTKTYSQVVETNNLFKSSNLKSYGSNTSFSFDNELLKIKNSGYGGTELGTFNLNGSDYLFVDCIIKSQKAVDLGIMDSANGFKGAIRISNGSAKDVIYKDKIDKSVFENYGLTDNFKLVLLSSSLDWSLNHLLISNKSYNADTLNLEIKKLDDAINILKDTSPNMNYIYVSSSYTSSDDGFGETKFNNLIDANNSIKYNSKENPYTIIVKKGTYSFNDIYSGNTSSEYQGVITKDYVYYESEDINRPELCIIEWDGATGIVNPTDEVLIYKSPFHIVHEKNNYSKLHTHIKGFKLNVRNCRYGLHVETQGRGLDVEWSIENCIVNWYGRPNSTNNKDKAPAIGMGMTAFENGVIRRCQINTLEEGNNLGLMVHDNAMSSSYNYTPYLTDGAKLLIDSCKFNDKDIIANTGKYTSTDLSHIIHIKNVKGINVAKAGTISGETKTNWKAIVECSDIIDNRF